jgi:Tol biopolymer transport system component
VLLFSCIAILFSTASCNVGEYRVEVIQNNKNKVGSYQISPDSHWVVFQLCKETETFCRETEIYSRPINSGTDSTIKLGDAYIDSPLSNTLIKLGDAHIDSPLSNTLIIISPDSRWVVYEEEEGSWLEGVFTTVDELYSVRIDGNGTPIQLGVGASSIIPAEGNKLKNLYIEHVTVIPDSSRVVYEVSTELLEVSTDLLGEVKVSLYSVPIDGSSAPVKLSDGFILRWQSKGYTISSDGSQVVYMSESSELYSVPIDGSSAPVKLSGDGIETFTVSPDGK